MAEEKIDDEEFLRKMEQKYNIQILDTGTQVTDNTGETTTVSTPIRKKGKGRPEKFTKEQELQLIERVERFSHTAKDLAKEFNCSTLTILRVFKKHGKLIRSVRGIRRVTV